jgi:hypothetical protein
MAANPNTMTFKQVFHTEYQMSHFRQPVYQVLAETSLEAQLTKGQVLSRSYASDVMVNDMGADGSYVTQAITDTAETLTINKEKEASIYVKDLDELQAHLPLKRKYGKKLANALINQIDGDVLLAAYLGAGNAMDDGNVGAGTATNGLDVTSANVASMFNVALTRLRLNNVVTNKRFDGGGKMQLEMPDGMPIAIVPAEVVGAVELYLGGKATLLGDQVSRNGYEGYLFGFNIFLSNALPWTGQLALATNPTAGDTVTVNGVTWTFRAIPALAGEIDIGADPDANRILLQNAINGSATGLNSATGYFEVSTANRRLLKNITATDVAGSDVLNLVASGWGTVVVSETLTAGGDVWTATKQKVYALFGLSKSISLVVQKDPNLTNRPSPESRIGEDLIAWTVYGIKMFQDQAAQVISFAVKSSAYGAALQSPK